MTGYLVVNSLHSLQPPWMRTIEANQNAGGDSEPSPRVCGREVAKRVLSRRGVAVVRIFRQDGIDDLLGVGVHANRPAPNPHRGDHTRSYGRIDETDGPKTDDGLRRLFERLSRSATRPR